MTQKPDAVEICPDCRHPMNCHHDGRGVWGKGCNQPLAMELQCPCQNTPVTFTTIEQLAAERDALKAEVAAGKQWRERCEELEVVAAALYLGHDDGRMQFDIYRSLYIATADDDIMWERAALEGESR